VAQIILGLIFFHLLNLLGIGNPAVAGAGRGRTAGTHTTAPAIACKADCLSCQQPDCPIVLQIEPPNSYANSPVHRELGTYKNLYTYESHRKGNLFQTNKNILKKNSLLEGVVR
jgi:hypothetical protein